MAREEVESEVTGTVWKIETKVGDKVAEGDVLMIIESMMLVASRVISEPRAPRSFLIRPAEPR